MIALGQVLLQTLHGSQHLDVKVLCGQKAPLALKPADRKSCIYACLSHFGCLSAYC